MNGTEHRPHFGLFFVTLVAGLWLVFPSSSSAQQTNADSGFAASTAAKQDAVTVTPEKPAPYDIGGIVAQAFKIKKPLQMLNPLAPAKYGDGRDNVSWDPDKPEKPKGIILLGIQW